MLLCLVTGTVVAPRKDEAFRPAKLLVVHPVDAEGAPTDAPDLLALDAGYGAGVGDYVLVAKEGAVAQQVMHGEPIAANVVVLGVVDDWSYDA